MAKKPFTQMAFCIRTHQQARTDRELINTRAGKKILKHFQSSTSQPTATYKHSRRYSEFLKIAIQNPA